MVGSLIMSALLDVWLFFIYAWVGIIHGNKCGIGIGSVPLPLLQYLVCIWYRFSHIAGASSFIRVLLAQ